MSNKTSSSKINEFSRTSPKYPVYAVGEISLKLSIQFCLAHPVYMYMYAEEKYEFSFDHKLYYESLYF